MLRSIVVLTAALLALTSCGDAPTAVPALPDDPRIEPPVSAETITLVATVREFTEDEFTLAMVEEVEDEALARYLRATLSELASAARTGTRASVLRVLNDRPLDQIWEGHSRLSPDDELAVAEMDILLGHIEWWLGPRPEPTAEGGPQGERSGETGS